MTAVSEIIDLRRLTQWLDSVDLGSGPITDVVELTGGTQNILIRFTRNGEGFVLRRPPLHKRPNSDETMMREVTVLETLAGSRVPHPALVASCEDLDVLGCCFFIMEEITGFTATATVPEPFASDPQLQKAMGLSMVDALAALGEVSVAAPEIARLGRGDRWLERQVARWRKQLDSYSNFDGWTGADLPDVEQLGRWLDRHRPDQGEPGLIHGDFHIANVLFSQRKPQVAAVVDWELATIGDPLVDLGHMLATWPDPSRSERISPQSSLALADSLPGLPLRDEVIDRYRGRSSRDVAAIDWYQALACYRLAILVEGTYARACAGQASRDVGDRLHDLAIRLLAQGLELAEPS